MSNEFHRGDIWLFDPDPTRGREQKKSRPCVILSVDTYNNGPADLLIVVPMTTKNKSIPCHIPTKVDGLDQVSYIMCDQIRCIAKERIEKIRKQTKLASVNKKTLEEIERCLKVLLGFNSEN
jgi:mRNA interferase MazF